MRGAGAGSPIPGSLRIQTGLCGIPFWIGVYPGMTDEMLDYMIQTVKEAVNQEGYPMLIDES